MPAGYLAQQGVPYALLRVHVLIEWESGTQPAALTATIGDDVHQVPTTPTRPGRYGGYITVPLNPADERLSVRLRATSPSGSTSTITKTLTLQKGGDVPLYKLVQPYGDLPAGTIVTPTTPAGPVYDPALLAKSAAAPYNLTADQAGWHNTGVPAGTVLTPTTGDYRVTSGTRVLEDLDITGSVYAQTATVILRRCRITDGGMAIQTGLGGHVVLEDCEIDGAAGGAQVKIGYSNITLRRCLIRRGVDLLRANSNVLAEDCFFTDLTEAEPYHNDCVQSDKGSNVTLRRCSFIAFNDGWVPGQNPGANSPLILKPDNGDITNYVVDSCVFGGGNAVYLSGVIQPTQTMSGGRLVNLQFTNNLFHGDSLHADLAVSEDMAYLSGFRNNRRLDGADMKVLVYKANGEAAIRYLKPSALEIA